MQIESSKSLINKKVRDSFVIRLFVIIISLLSSSCEREYDRGYNAGYEKGYSKGKSDGYESGHAFGYISGKSDGYSEGYEKGEGDGYKKGYVDGTTGYIKENSLPSIGLAVVVLIFVAAIFFIYKYFKYPTKRIIEKAIASSEEARQRILAQKELNRKRFSVEEQSRIKARNLANKVFEKTIKAITDEKSKTEIEALRQKAEKKILSIQLETILKIADEYQQSIEELKKSGYLTSKEKAELFSEIREVINES